MTPADNSRPVDAVDEARLNEAAEWLITLREQPADPQVIANWLQWRQAHPDNPRAFSEIEEIWTMTGGAESALLPQGHESPPAASNEPSSESGDHKAPRWTRWSIAAGLAATLLLGVFAWRGDLRNSDETPVEYATTRAAQRELRLSDGSTIVLGGDSAVRVAYTAARRDIALLRGEAHFAVQHDTQRPFVVSAHAISATAVGTAFNVRADGARIVVSVSEGIVEVGPGLPDVKQPVLRSTLRARAGQQVVLDSPADKHAALNVQLGDTSAPNDWQEGLLSFVDEPLSSVIARVNRYAQHNIAFDEATLGELRFTGTVFRDRIDDWALGLEKVFPIDTHADTQGNISLSGRRSVSQ